MDLENLINLDPVERLRFLESNAAEVHDNQHYIYQFSDEEKEAMRGQYVIESIKLNEIKVRKDEAMKDFKEEMKEPKRVSSELLEKLTHGMEQRKGKVFEVHDYENKRLYMIAENGKIISERRLVSGQQKSILSAVSKTG